VQVKQVKKAVGAKPESTWYGPDRPKVRARGTVGFKELLRTDLARCTYCTIALPALA
jgi:hypothetical protein